MSQMQTNKAPEKQSFCLRKDHHRNEKVNYICLENACFLNRVLCKKCVHQDHRKHKVGIIDKLVEPLSRLSMNSGMEDSAENYDYLYGRIQEIVQEWQKINDIFDKTMKELEDTILFQMQTVTRTFTNEEMNEAYDILMNPEAKIEDIDAIVKKMNFLDKEYLQDAQDIKVFMDYLTERTKKSLSKSVKAVEKIFQKTMNHIHEFDFTKFQEFTSNPEGCFEGNKTQEKAEQPKLTHADEEEEDVNTIRKEIASQRKVSQVASNRKIKNQNPSSSQKLRNDDDGHEPKLSNLNNFVTKQSAFHRFHH